MEQLKLSREATLHPAAHPFGLLTDEVIPHELLNKSDEIYLMEMYPNKGLVYFCGVIKCTFPPPLVKQAKANLTPLQVSKYRAGKGMPGLLIREFSFLSLDGHVLGQGDTGFCGKCLHAWLISGPMIKT